MKPAPKSTHVVCEACGLAWDKHGEKPTLETCVSLLKAELAKRPSFAYSQLGATGVGYGINISQSGMQ